MDQQSRRDHASHLTPQEFFAQCEEKARVPDKEAWERALSWIAGQLTFTFPTWPFEPDPLLAAAPSPGDSEELKAQKFIQSGARYWKLVEMLKEHRSRNERWILLALWLMQAGICEPWEFLPQELYNKLTREKREGLGISIRDQQHYHRVEAWKPYFEQLLADRRAKKDLMKAGYHEPAIVAVQRSRAAVPAACAWLASRGDTDAPTLRNAHSRVSRKIQHHKTADGSL